MNKTLFLDRDGVINEDFNYVHKIQDFKFIDGIFELVSRAKDLGYLVIVITNQAGIGRNLYSEDCFLKLTKWMISKFKEKEIIIDAVYYCPYHPIHGKGKYKKDSFLRKPKPGMILKASEDYCIDLKNSILVGDKVHDIEAGISAGIKKNYLFSKEKTFDIQYELITSFDEIIF